MGLKSGILSGYPESLVPSGLRVVNSLSLCKKLSLCTGAPEKNTAIACED
ncbi:hypothetical protein Barb4_02243 [Bacteroidales bacterium Barb4]|nr:hypothetical protein Barb4_02243 [Bacteroidales bacterium Barb4]